VTVTHAKISLCVVVANTPATGANDISAIIRALGHEVVSPGPGVDVEGASKPDLAVVGPDPAQVLNLFASIGEETRPLVALLSDVRDDVITEAAKVGASTYIVGQDPESWPVLIEMMLRPFVAFSALEGALRRRAVIERAKGILMERDDLAEREAFELLRGEARHTNHQVVEVAAAVVGGRRLLARRGEIP
jgi:AmiR/NasT family two-component response regulator